MATTNNGTAVNPTNQTPAPQAPRGGEKAEELTPDVLDQLFAEGPENEVGGNEPPTTYVPPAAEVTLEKRRAWGEAA